MFNKKADGSCGKILKYVINFYHTTSQILVNGSKIEIFITDILEKLGLEMKERCSQLDIINTNIASVLTKDTIQTETINSRQIESSNASENKTNIDNTVMNSAETETDDDVCEICPICQEQAYGKVVQCGECVEWFHYECIDINDTAIDTLGSEDFICVHCTDNLKYSVSEKESDMSIHNENTELENIHVINIDESLNQDKSSVNQVAYEQQTHELNTSKPPVTVAPCENKASNSQNGENNTKVKPKRSTKTTSKVNKDDIGVKSYILDLENQINVLKSTLNLYEKSNDSKKPSELKQEEQSCKSDQMCKHNCCSDMKDKLQENRIRMLEMQMMQNLYINNALHIQLASQNRPYYYNTAQPMPPPAMPAAPNVYHGQFNQGIWNQTPYPYQFTTYGCHQPNMNIYQPPWTVNHPPRPQVIIPTPAFQPPQYRATTMNTPVYPVAQSNVQQQTLPLFNYQNQPELNGSHPQPQQKSDTTQGINKLPNRQQISQKNWTVNDTPVHTDHRRKNHNQPNEKPRSGEKRHSENSTVDKSELSAVNIQSIPEPDPEICERINSNENYIHIKDTPEKLHQIRTAKGNQSSGPFLSLPPRKHNPPELIRQIQAEDSREQALSPAI